jgi:hypothetical protein
MIVVIVNRSLRALRATTLATGTESYNNPLQSVLFVADVPGYCVFDDGVFVVQVLHGILVNNPTYKGSRES